MAPIIRDRNLTPHLGANEGTGRLGPRLHAFERDVEAASDGRIDVKIFWNNQLGKIETVVNMVRQGRVEGAVAFVIGRVNGRILARFGAARDLDQAPVGRQPWWR